MLKKTAVENILTAALESGADFAEIYAEEAKRSSISMVNGRGESALGGMVTVQAIRELIPELEAAGVTFVTVSQLARG